MEKMVVIINGVETELDDKEYIEYLKRNHKPINEYVLETFGGR